MKIETGIQAGWTYTVKTGDSLWKIAETNYGDGKVWPQIYQYHNNKSVIGPNPNLIRRGMKIELW